MEMVKLGKEGQVSIPKAVLKRLGLEGDIPMLAETTPDGVILLCPAGIYPLEIYSEERIQEFDEADRMDSKAAACLTRALRR